MKIPRKSYFNCLEQLMYVSPIQMIKNIIPKEYRDFGDYPDINKMINEIWKNEKD